MLNRALCLVVFLFLSCNEEREKVNIDYLIFGDFYGECGGEGCIDIYKIENENLYEDTKDLYPSWETPYDGNYVKLSTSKYNEVNSLLQKFPEKLLHETDTVLGMPDAGDWGGYYIEIHHNNQRRFWLIDKMGAGAPAYLRPFLEDLEVKLNLL
jgi:hypothetical protein